VLLAVDVTVGTEVVVASPVAGLESVDVGTELDMVELVEISELAELVELDELDVLTIGRPSSPHAG